MFRTILATLTIAALLLCPLRCSATGPAEGAEVQSGCGCCQSACADRPAPPSDEPAPDGCECANCLCHGAVLEGGTKLTSLALFPFSLECSLVEFALATPATALVSRNEPRDDGITLSGRAVCILQQSLQI